MAADTRIQLYEQVAKATSKATGQIEHMCSRHDVMEMATYLYDLPKPQSNHETTSKKSVVIEGHSTQPQININIPQNCQDYPRREKSEKPA